MSYPIFPCQVQPLPLLVGRFQHGSWCSCRQKTEAFAAASAPGARCAPAIYL